MKIRNKIGDYFSDEVNKNRFLALFLFIVIITALAWQSDDAYHAYAMSKNLVDGNGFVYNVGERASSSSCPLFTLIVAFGYLIFRNMFLVSLLICIVFSSWAFSILLHSFCKDRKQIIAAFLISICSVSFISYTTAGLENCLLFLLAALFLKKYLNTDTYGKKDLLYMAILISLIAMTRMDAVLMFVPMVVYLYLVKRNRVSFIGCCGIAIAGLLPFILWELFSVFYFGFFVPNTAFVKLGTDIAKSEYLKRGLQYLFTTLLCDPLVIVVPVTVALIAVLIKRAKYFYLAAGIALYFAYVIYIGGDFMLGRHFTVMFFMALIAYFDMHNKVLSDSLMMKNRGLTKLMELVCVLALIFTFVSKPVSDQFLFGNTFNSPISDERAGYFKWTSLFNNAVSYLRTGEICIRGAWNESDLNEYRKKGFKAIVDKNIPGIMKYYNDDMYLNDFYALGDPFLSKLPAVIEPNWRIGHMHRDPPKGYIETIDFQLENEIENESIHQYYDVIRLITRGDLFDKNRIQAIIDINLGKYDYLLDEYKATLNEFNMQEDSNE